jgi:DNA-binding NtrC family response regulator
MAMTKKQEEPTPEPAELWQQALELEQRAHEMRTEALHAALERSHGMVSKAATILGLHRSTVRNLIDSTNVYPGLQEYAAKLRADAGYRRGGVSLHLRVNEGESEE